MDEWPKSKSNAGRSSWTWKARQYLVLRAVSIAADQALALCRDRHRSSMIGKASEAFETISRALTKGWLYSPGKDGETLIALARDGGSKAANQLSKGARFQLYLALRADDIMETFDDFRAEEAFRLFAGMAERGQVVYMTRHRYLTAIAREVCPLSASTICTASLPPAVVRMLRSSHGCRDVVSGHWRLIWLGQRCPDSHL